MGWHWLPGNSTKKERLMMASSMEAISSQVLFLDQMDELDRARLYHGLTSNAPWPIICGVELDPLAIILYSMSLIVVKMGGATPEAKAIGRAVGEISTRLDALRTIVRAGLITTAQAKEGEWGRGFEAGARVIALGMGEALKLGGTAEEMLGVQEEEKTQAA